MNPDFSLQADLLRKALVTLGFYSDSDRTLSTLVDQLTVYSQELMFWNSRMNIVGKMDDQFYLRHLLDSLSPLGYLRGHSFKEAADVGSGGGLPGIPLALAFPDSRWSLIERSNKKAGFLRNAVALLGLSDRVEILQSPVEQVNSRFDLVTFRAFRQFEDFFSHIKRLLNEDGLLFAYKGVVDKAVEELAGVGLTVEEVEIVPLIVPGLDESRCGIAYRN